MLDIKIDFIAQNQSISSLP